MNTDIHTIVVGEILTPPYNRMLEQSRRLFSTHGISPTLHTCGGGGQVTKILVEYD